RIASGAGSADSRRRRQICVGGGIEAPRACPQGSGARSRAHRYSRRGARVQFQADGRSPAYVGGDPGLGARTPLPDVTMYRLSAGWACFSNRIETPLRSVAGQMTMITLTSLRYRLLSS